MNLTLFFRRLKFGFSYLFRPPWDSGIPAPEVARFAADHPAGRALDIGCGTGTNLLYLAQHGWRVTGIDFAALAIEKARRKLQGCPAKLLTADVTRLAELDLPGPYDLALDMGCFHSLGTHDRPRYASGLAQWMKPQGMYLVYAFQPAEGERFQGLTRAEMIACFQDAFTLVNYEQGQGRASAWYYFTRKA